MIKIVQVEGIKLGEVNSNGRLYPRDVMMKADAEFKERLIDTDRAMGELNRDYSRKVDWKLETYYSPFEINLVKRMYNCTTLFENINNLTIIN